MVLINCHSCQLQIAKCSELRHMNNVHGPAGTMPKTAAELNEDEGPQAQRWRDCQWCGGHFIGIKQHVKKCPSRPAVAPAEPAAAAAAAAAPGGIGNAAENAGDAENAGQPVGDAENAGQPLEEAGNVGQQAGAGGNVGQQEGAAENVGQLAGAAGNVGQQMGDGRVAGANGNEIAGEEEEAVDYGRLVAEFNKGLYSPHHASIEYIKQIFIILLRQAVEDSVVRSVEAIVALQLIAGMVQFLKDNARRKVMKPQDMLRAIIASPNKATCIINLAKQFRKLKRVRGDQAPRQPNVEITRAEIEKLINDTVSEHGRLDYMFNNAGIALMGELKDMIPDQYKRIIDVNIMGIVNGSRIAYAQMLKQGSGHIVNVGSVAGLFYFPIQTQYSATKHFVQGFTMGLRAEAAGYGVKASVICPMNIKSDMVEGSITMVGSKDNEWFRNLPVKWMDANMAARKMLKGVARNKGIIIVPSGAKIIWRLFRMSPAAYLFIAEKAVEKFRKM